MQARVHVPTHTLANERARATRARAETAPPRAQVVSITPDFPLASEHLLKLRHQRRHQLNQATQY